MFRVNAMWRIAAGAVMAYNEPLWNWSAMQFPGYLVGPDDT